MSRKKRVTLVENDFELKEAGLDIGLDRLHFLEKFTQVKPALDSYVEVCATRLSIAGITNANLLPENEYLTLPHGTEFLTRFLGDESRAQHVDRIRMEARNFDASNISKAVAPAARFIRHIYEQSRNLDEQHRNTLMKLLSSMSMALLVLTMKLRSNPGPNYQLSRSRLRNEYEHFSIFKDLMALIIDFDFKAENLLMLRHVRTEKGVNDRMKILIEAAKQIKEIIIQACINMEERMLELKYGIDTEAVRDNLLNVAIFVTQASDHNEQLVTTLEAAEEIVDPKAAFDKKLAKNGKVRVVALPQPERDTFKEADESPLRDELNAQRERLKGHKF